MAKSNKEKGLVIGGAVVGLLMGGTAIGATGTMTDSGEFFKFSEVRSSYQLAAEDTAEVEEVEEVEEVDVEEVAGEADEDKTAEGDKKCGEGDKKCSEDKCGEGSCG